MIRNHSTAAVPGLSVSDVNFNFTCFVHNYGFCFLQFLVLQFLHHQDSVSFWNLSSRTFCPIRCSKNVQHWHAFSAPSPTPRNPESMVLCFLVVNHCIEKMLTWLISRMILCGADVNFGFDQLYQLHCIRVYTHIIESQYNMAVSTGRLQPSMHWVLNCGQACTDF